jgi:hypothetical protein
MGFRQNEFGLVRSLDIAVRALLKLEVTEQERAEAAKRLERELNMRRDIASRYSKAVYQRKKGGS